MLMPRCQVSGKLVMLRYALSALLVLAAGVSAAVAQNSIMPGQLFDVADTQLHLLCTGEGQPTIVLEAGLAGNYLDWTFVQPILAHRFRTCAYDRAGAGFSQRTERPRSLAAMTDELHRLMAAADVKQPVILVGHSFGGLLALAYAQAYRGSVAGLVLLDPMHPEQFERFPAVGVDLPVEPNLILGRTSSFAALYGLPAALHPLALELAGQDKARVFVVRELRGMIELAHSVHGLPLPQVPSRILLHGNREWDSPYPDGRMENAWTLMQGELASAIGAAPPLAIITSGHQLALDSPNVVVATIVGLVATLPVPAH